MTDAIGDASARLVVLCAVIHDLAVQMARAIAGEELDHLLTLLQQRDAATEKLAAAVAQLGVEEWRLVLDKEPHVREMLATVAGVDLCSRDKLLALLRQTRDELDGIRRGRATLTAYRSTLDRTGSTVDLVG